MLLRTGLRQLPTTSSRICAARPLVAAARQATAVPVQQTRSAHAISNPTLANIEKRWEAMPPQEQADLWMALRDRMKVDWNELTLQEKKAGTLLYTCGGLGLNGLIKWGDGREPLGSRAMLLSLLG